jgi:pantoate--beta-alanine ligase
MQRLESLARWREFAEGTRAGGSMVGLVPTMGALHDGHRALMAAARRAGDTVLVTIFVNPRQFNDETDLDRYPRDLEGDLAICESEGVAAVALPPLEEMWPHWPTPTPTTVSVHGVADDFEGAGRPGHFDGVASVVAKLVAVTGPCRAYFGEKDYQQLAVVQQMVSDLALPVEVVGVGTVRDPDGLALSSRNRLLDPAQRALALRLSAALAAVGDGVSRTADEVRARLRDCLEAPDFEVAYAEVVDPVTLRRLGSRDEGPARVLLCGRVGGANGVRLIDNGPVTIRSEVTPVTGH